MTEKRSISRDLGALVPRKQIKMKGTGAATKGTKWYAYADQITDTATPPPKIMCQPPRRFNLWRLRKP